MKHPFFIKALCFTLLCCFFRFSALSQTISDTVRVQACDSIVYQGVVYHTSHQWTDTLQGLSPAPDTLRFHQLLVGHTYRHTDTITACDTFRWSPNHQLFYSSTQTTFTNTQGQCDSIFHLLLTMRHNSRSSTQTQACDHYNWEGIHFQPPTGFSNYPYLIDTTLSILNSYGCDASKRLQLSIYPSRHDTTQTTVCDQYTWDQNNFTYSTSGVYTMHYYTSQGCDSSISLDLHIILASITYLTDSFCTGSTYQFYDQMVSHSGSFNQNFCSSRWPYCDSIEVIMLTELPRPTIQFAHWVDCINQKQYLEVLTNVDYIRWSNEGTDTTLLGQETSSILLLQPYQEATYYVFADYYDTLTCPASASYQLSPLIEPHALMQLSTTTITPYRPSFVASNQSSGTLWHEWLFDQEFVSTDSIISYAPPLDSDSLLLSLVAHSQFCTDTHSAIIHVFNETLFVPNAFAPDQTSAGLFSVQGTGIIDFNMKIYNRQGQLVFHTTDINATWDGTFQHRACPAGGYVVDIRYSTHTNPNRFLKKVSSLTLIR